jgi:hypothetical protein
MAKFVDRSSAVFTSNRFDRAYHEEGGDDHPPPGREFALAIGKSLKNAGFVVRQRDTEPTDPRDDWWEHGYWYLFLSHDDADYSVLVECIPDSDRYEGFWRVSVTRRVGFLGAIFGNRSAVFNIPVDLRQQLEKTIQETAETTDLRWMSAEDSEAYFGP